MRTYMSTCNGWGLLSSCNQYTRFTCTVVASEILMINSNSESSYKFKTLDSIQEMNRFHSFSFIVKEIHWQGSQARQPACSLHRQKHHYSNTSK